MATQAPQGVFLAPGIDDYDTVAFTFSAHGVVPSIIVVNTYEEHLSRLSGRPFDCQFRYENTTARFPDCIVDAASVSFSSGNRVTLRIFDHRWRWKNAKDPYTVHANRRVGKKIMEDTKQSARELAVELLRAAGEDRFDVGLVPSNAFPDVQITGALPPMVELEQLVGLYGLRVCYTPQTSRVTIVRPGVGRSLPPHADYTSVALDPPELPSGILIIGSEVRFQCRWKLEAVAKEKDGKRVKLDEASYRPSDGWNKVSPLSVATYLDSTDDDMRKAAEQSVYKEYRLVRTEDSGDRASNIAPWLTRFRDRDGEPITVTKLSQVLPVTASLIDTEELPDGTEKPLTGKVTGDWTHDSVEPRGSKKNVDDGSYPGSWTLDGERGIVAFSEPVYILDVDDQSRGPYKPAKLEVELTFGVRTGADQLPLRVFWEAGLSNNNSGLRPFRRDELTQAIKFNGRAVDDGRAEMEQIARVLEAEIKAGLQRASGQVAVYNFLVVPQPDGALQQYNIRAGTQGCQTSISRNIEASLVSPSYAQRKRLALQNAELEQ